MATIREIEKLAETVSEELEAEIISGHAFVLGEDDEQVTYIAEEMDVKREGGEPSQFPVDPRRPIASRPPPPQWDSWLREDTSQTWAELLRRGIDPLTPAIPAQPPSILPKRTKVVRKPKVIKESAPPPPPEPKKPSTTPGLGKRKLDI